MKTYQYKNVTYGFNLALRKWTFKSERACIIMAVKGGAENAHKIAGHVYGALRRTKGEGLDGMARANIKKINA